MGPLLGLISLLSGAWFLIGMPVIAAAYAWQDSRNRKLSTGLLVTVVMLVVFYINAGLIWWLITSDWKLSFLTMLEASVNSEKYGHPVEHRAEVMLVWLLLVSTLTAVAAGAVVSAARHFWVKRRRAAA